MNHLLTEIPPLDKASGKKAEDHLNQLTKPPGSLGRMEDIAVKIAEITGNPFPAAEPPGILVFAADHGIAEEGISAFPSEVTALMAANFAAGGAAINVFARMIDARLKVADIGIKEEKQDPGVENCRIRNGTGNFLKEKAMTAEEAESAILTGKRLAAELIDAGVRCLIPGEMGIGNTTSAAALTAAITGKDPGEVTGKGTGITAEAQEKKANLIRKALTMHNPDRSNAVELLSAAGGLEIAGMCGAIIAAAEHRVPVLLDGFICTAAACLAVLINPDIKGYLIAGHQSEEPGHKTALEWLGLKPLLQLQLRLGEGSGAAIAYPIIKGSVRMLSEMATFEKAGINVT
ncbi:nicotinate-nucleotide--dimethylbenzimidazole phosphoribosyltransferase [Bacillus mangrovi]|uniref:Nicotinate-nucleotide--dimethylbenzimidazole phosphoribosyltransferase n=1 Tax=Metabacillus mangrovi TaxID=1491830 RepID=A0A7X2S219_9BACI|nr:nicotinate-nucleotide--dimethylbenzimidazole phosphoribosyltransferase [Metabacillus mangrovi]MTH51967.1 nicotinate-nucleotide--dimethylbenzimidazole phosphoribosyltransferase [Metabacillus mangrovi]